MDVLGSELLVQNLFLFLVFWRAERQKAWRLGSVSFEDRRIFRKNCDSAAARNIASQVGVQLETLQERQDVRSAGVFFINEMRGFGQKPIGGTDETGKPTGCGQILFRASYR